MTTNTSAGPLIIDRADDYLYYVDNQDTAPFIGRLKLNINGTVTAEESFITATGRIFGLAMDARVQHRKVTLHLPPNHTLLVGTHTCAHTCPSPALLVGAWGRIRDQREDLL
jgi:hypothetical protein